MHIEDIKKLSFLNLNYQHLEFLNEYVKKLSLQESTKFHIEYIEKQDEIKAITICFSDIEGVLHMLDYDKKYLLKSLDNLTFDGSSVRGFSATDASDLRLVIDWSSVVYPPGDIFGSGKVLAFANITYPNGDTHPSSFRGRLQLLASELSETQGIQVNMAPEIEGFLLRGIDAEQHYDSRTGFELVSTGGYYHSLPLDELKQFIDRAADVQRAMGFNNEKDHPEVAPSQFEINFRYTDVIRACDQTQLYKLVCRQIAMTMGMTATFLPKPVQNINGSGMHINISISNGAKNLFYQKNGEFGLSKIAWHFIETNLNRAPELCLIYNSSVNAYRRLDPNFEAPNQIKVSANNREAMIRVPTANQSATRIEFRSIAPDSNLYFTMFAIIKTGLNDVVPPIDESKRPRVKFLPSTIHDSLRNFKASDYITEIIGDTAKQKFIDSKQLVADRSSKDLGSRIKTGEVIYHHEVTNQELWSHF